ncbi:hypothetical protein Tco_0999546 [Tanacetum coccineum]
MGWIDSFVSLDSEVLKRGKEKDEGSVTRAEENSSKRAGTELEQERIKKQKIDDDKKEVDMKKHMEIVPDDEVAVDAIPLATKPPIIVDWKIIKEGKMGYCQLIRADKSSRRNTRPEEAYERVLWGDLKVMFEPDIESEVWKNLQGYHGRIVGIKRLHDELGVNTTNVTVTAAKHNLLLLLIISEKYAKISFDEYDDEDYMVIYDKNSLSYKILYVDDLKMDMENDNDEVNMPLFPSPKPTVSYFDDLDYFKNIEKEFPAIVYNNALTSKLDFLTEPIVSPQHIDKFNLKDETLLSECDEEEQDILYFNDIFPFNVIYPNDLKPDKENDNDKINIKQPLGDMSIIPLPNVININVAAYAQGSNKLLETSHDTISKTFTTKIFSKELNVNIMAWNYLNNEMLLNLKNLYLPFGIPFDPKLFYNDKIKLGQV